MTARRITSDRGRCTRSGEPLDQRVVRSPSTAFAPPVPELSAELAVASAPRARFAGAGASTGSASFPPPPDDTAGVRARLPCSASSAHRWIPAFDLRKAR